VCVFLCIYGYGYGYTHAAAHVYGGGSSMRATMKSFQTAGGGASLMSFVPAADHGIQQGIPTYDSVYAAAG
jgi:hypothetical protein